MSLAREIRSLAINGSAALVDGYRPDGPSTVYYYKGAFYEADQSPETAAWFAEGARTRKLGPGLYPLEAIIGDKVEHGQVQYLARWVGTDEMTYEPAGNFRAEDIAECQAEKAELDNIVIGVNLDDAKSNYDGTVDINSTASVTKLADATPQAATTDEADVAMEGAEAMLPVIAADVDAHGTDTSASLADQVPAMAVSSDLTDAEDEYENCNDRAGVDLVEKHGKAHRCQGKRHSGPSVYTCDECRRETVAMLDEKQKLAIERGADRPLCHECGEEHVEDAQASFECKCSTMTLCGSCLDKMADDLAAAREALVATNEETTCGVCSEDLQGDEKVTKCALCRGLKSLDICDHRLSSSQHSDRHLSSLRTRFKVSTSADTLRPSFSRSPRTMPGAMSRELRGLRVSGTPALVGGPIPTTTLPTYQWRGGARYAVDGEYAAAYAAQAPHERTGETIELTLQAIIGKRTNNTGDTQYLALWAPPFTPRDATWEPTENFSAPAIQHFEQQEAEFDEPDYESGADFTTQGVAEREQTDVEMQDVDIDDEATMVSTIAQSSDESMAKTNAQPAAEPASGGASGGGPEVLQELLDLVDNMTSDELNQVADEAIATWQNGAVPAGFGDEPFDNAWVDGLENSQDALDIHENIQVLNRNIYMTEDEYEQRLEDNWMARYQVPAFVGTEEGLTFDGNIFGHARRQSSGSAPVSPRS
ncbi:hypothetical protein LTR85_000937 [Meristemomyces frigidus]|nr:hypothetical protein LTR85_000937 [Meristemomyces frigidus]